MGVRPSMKGADMAEDRTPRTVGPTGLPPNDDAERPSKARDASKPRREAKADREPAPGERDASWDRREDRISSRVL